MHFYQRTIAKPVVCSGVGVHSGKKVTLTIKPAPPNHGIKFVRTDLPDNPSVPALFKMVVDTSLATVIGRNGVIVSTIEHLMASFAGLSIDNAIVELDSYEMPIMDGSAYHYTRLINEAGITEDDIPRYFFIIKEPIKLEENGKSVCVYPSSEFKLTCSIDFDHPLIRQQTFIYTMDEEIFTREISGARTFGFMHDYEYYKRYGLARGASMGSGIVIDKDKVINEEGLRFQDEFVRHKTLDCIGDFSLLGMPILGHIVTKKTGHAFNYAFLEEFFAQKECWETGPIHNFEEFVS